MKLKVLVEIEIECFHERKVELIAEGRNAEMKSNEINRVNVIVSVSSYCVVEIQFITSKSVVLGSIIVIFI